MKALPHLNKALQAVQHNLGDMSPQDFAVETNLKPYPSIKRKMELENLQEPTDLSDLVRGRLFFSARFQEKEVLDILKQIFGSQIKQIDKKHERGNGLSYNGVVHLALEIGGAKFELQVLPMEFQPYEEFLHRIYEKLRGGATKEKQSDKLTDKRKKMLAKIHNRLRAKIVETAKSNRLVKNDH
jgi:hypothetical protein